ncbi:hypothetical protein PHMEG_00016018 [Phytophthora megakarya]|uniref:Uncharacterized protein n=1 Tax=Phytophthora megakarya TaxID=4795 RepID=A0A225W1C5_9STRA|nr:hypothetical protein PHMEG_00016018 [Phytophthora megakarya]
MMFPSMSERAHLQPILKMCLASLVEHSAYLRLAFVLESRRNKLAGDVAPTMDPTGIPPYTYL